MLQQYIAHSHKVIFYYFAVCISNNNHLFRNINEMKILITLLLFEYICFANCLHFPIIQLSLRNKLLAELFLDDNVYSTVSKIKSSINSLTSQHNLSPINSNDILKSTNIYSDYQLQLALSDSNLTLLMINKNDCQKCRLFTPHFNEITHPCISYRYHADSDNIPNYMDELYIRLSGKVHKQPYNDITNNDKRSGNVCVKCSDTGIETCSKCNGVGYTLVNNMALYCNFCLGKKMVRCSSCGGKCISC
jgi:hypothetical protein